MGASEVMSILRGRDPAVCAILMTGHTHEPVFRDHTRHGFAAALAGRCRVGCPDPRVRDFVLPCLNRLSGAR